MSDSVALQCDHLSIGYPSKVVQQDLSFSLRKGEMVCLLGPNGSGKSTLLYTLAGLLAPIDFQLSTLHSPLALVLTHTSALSSTTVHDVVAMGRYCFTSFLGSLTAQDEQVIAASLQAVGYDEGFGRRLFEQLSDGEKQRVLVAKALAQQTEIILLDEPTAHLDLPGRVQLFTLLSKLAHEEGKLVLVSTHELDLAQRFSDRILLLSLEGCELDTPSALRTRDAFSRAFGMSIP